MLVQVVVEVCLALQLPLQLGGPKILDASLLRVDLL